MLTIMHKLFGDYQKEVGNYEKAKEMYRLCIKNERDKGMLLDMYLSLIDLYIKCGEGEKARKYIDHTRKMFVQQRRVPELDFRLAKILESFDTFQRRL